MLKMNFEIAKELIRKNMEDYNYAVNTQAKFIHTLDCLCKHCNKENDISQIDYSDVQNFLSYLNYDKKLDASTINNYQAGIKFIFIVILKKAWNDKLFPYLKVTRHTARNITTQSVYSTSPLQGNISLEEAIKKIIIEMELRGLATGTQVSYLRCVKKFISFNQKNDNLSSLTLDDVKKFLHSLQSLDNLNPQTINIHRSSLKFFFIHALDIYWDDNKVPYLKPLKSVPVVLSKDEVITLIKAIDSDMYKTIALLMYSSGLRVSEAIKLRISDIDSKNMQIKIRGAKGKKDRYSILSQKCLYVLRDYYRKYRPQDYLFQGHKGNLYISKKSVQDAIKLARIKCGMSKEPTPHTLRHCFGTHLLENNTNLYYIKQLLGHNSIRTSSRYLQSISFSNMNVKSPLDMLGDKL